MALLEEQAFILFLALLLACFLAILVKTTATFSEPKCTAYSLKLQNSFRTPISEVQYQDCSGSVRTLRLNPGESTSVILRASNDIVRTGVLTLLSETTGSIVVTNVEFLGENRKVFFPKPDCGEVFTGDNGMELVFTGQGATQMCSFRLTSVR
jgi:hypothetical protein